MEMHESVVAACFVTTARFVTKVLKLAAMPARFVTNEEVTYLHIAHKKKLTHKTLRAHSAGYAQCIHVSSRKLKTTKDTHTSKVQTASTHPSIPKTAPIHSS